MRRISIWLALLVGFVLLGVPSPASAGSRAVDDREHFEVAGVAIAKVRFTYGKKRIKVVARYSYLAAGAVDQYQLELRGRHGRTWKIGWSPTDHSRFFTTFWWPGESAETVRCKVRWRESSKKQIAAVSFPARCLRLEGKPPPSWLRMGFTAEDFGQTYLFDSAPGGNSVMGDDSRLTKRIRRG